MSSQPLTDDAPTPGPHDRSENAPQADSAMIAKVRKLMAMAERSSNVEEADAFARKAAELVAAHRIDPERLHETNGAPMTVLEYQLGRGAYVRGRLAVLQVIAESQGCGVVFEARDHGTVAMVAGFRSDLDSVDVLYHSLHAQASARMAAERRSTAAATQRWRRSFLFGYANELREMFAATNVEAVQRIAPGRTSLPVLVARKEQVDGFMRERFGRVRRARPPAAAEARGYRAGRRAAANADLGRPRLRGIRAIGRGR